MPTPNTPITSQNNKPKPAQTKPEPSPMPNANVNTCWTGSQKADPRSCTSSNFRLLSASAKCCPDGSRPKKFSLGDDLGRRAFSMFSSQSGPFGSCALPVIHHGPYNFKLSPASVKCCPDGSPKIRRFLSVGGRLGPKCLSMFPPAPDVLRAARRL